MSLRVAVSLLLSATAVLPSRAALAQAPATAAASREVSWPEHTVAASPQGHGPDVTPRGRQWYGWETLSLDAAALGLGVMSYGTFDGQGTAGALLGSGALSAYAFGAPAVHLLRDQTGKALTSLGLRVGVPVLAVGVVSLASSDERCPAHGERDDAEYCQQHAKRVLLAAALSTLAVSLVDGALLAWEPAPKPKALALSPLVGWDGEKGGVAGVAGIF